jgi:hypothetical protein
MRAGRDRFFGKIPLFSSRAAGDELTATSGTPGRRTEPTARLNRSLRLRSRAAAEPRRGPLRLARYRTLRREMVGLRTRAVLVHEDGDLEVLRPVDLERPEPGPGRVRTQFPSSGSRLSGVPAPSASNPTVRDE